MESKEIYDIVNEIISLQESLILIKFFDLNQHYY